MASFCFLFCFSRKVLVFCANLLGCWFSMIFVFFRPHMPFPGPTAMWTSLVGTIALDLCLESPSASPDQDKSVVVHPCQTFEPHQPALSTSLLRVLLVAIKSEVQKFESDSSTNRSRSSAKSSRSKSNPHGYVTWYIIG